MQTNIFKRVKPITPSLRSLKILLKNKVFYKKPLKSKSFGKSSIAGRNCFGRITIRHRGGGHKRLYRQIDFLRLNNQGVVQYIEYDPFRNASIARVFDFKENFFYYILAPKNLISGSLVLSGLNAEIKIGHSLPFSRIPVGMLVHNVSTSLHKGGQYVRAAGSFAQLIQKTKKYARIRLCSGEQRLVPLNAKATLGVVSNENVKLVTLGKAGRSRWLGIRPFVRGVAMNPIDHPHGGGEGKTSGGRSSVTPWGKPTKGSKTSRSKNSFVVVPRKK